jgi:hypothetical protein
MSRLLSGSLQLSAQLLNLTHNAVQILLVTSWERSVISTTHHLSNATLHVAGAVWAIHAVLVRHIEKGLIGWRSVVGTVDAELSFERGLWCLVLEVVLGDLTLELVEKCLGCLLLVVGRDTSWW